MIVDVNTCYDVFEHSQIANARVSCEIKYARAFVYSENIAFNMFKIIEIINENEVKVHSEFIH